MTRSCIYHVYILMRDVGIFVQRGLINGTGPPSHPPPHHHPPTPLRFKLRILKDKNTPEQLL